MHSTGDLRQRLVRDDPDYQRLSRKHDEYDRRLAELRAQKYLSQDEQMEEVRLKKLKLAIKDRMEAIVRRAMA
ncbi:MAG TPA: YdcH family protein [Candidatus Polarisedimenticolaceae bacterium]|nr:YdcH family protein [Candidatus Polarisedimenticolaceae bacterium]